MAPFSVESALASDIDAALLGQLWNPLGLRGGSYAPRWNRHPFTVPRATDFGKRRSQIGSLCFVCSSEASGGICALRGPLLGQSQTISWTNV